MNGQDRRQTRRDSGEDQWRQTEGDDVELNVLRQRSHAPVIVPNRPLLLPGAGGRRRARAVCRLDDARRGIRRVMGDPITASRD
jgi:hypothetical protein